LLEAWIGGSGSTPKCHGFGTLLFIGTDEGMRNKWDSLQQSGACCGTLSYGDWYKVAHIRETLNISIPRYGEKQGETQDMRFLPSSCCKVSFYQCC
jgi:hypothetical protein